MKIIHPVPVGIKEQAPTAPATRAPAEGAAKAAPGLVASHGAQVL